MLTSVQTRWLFSFSLCILSSLSSTGIGAVNQTEVAQTEPGAQLDGILQQVKKSLNDLEFDNAVQHMLQVENSNHPSVLMLRAFRHELGVGAVIDSIEARELANRAAEQKDWEAAQFLAWQSITGNVGEPNLMESEQWRRKSIEWKTLNDHEPAMPERIMIPEKNGYVPRYELVNPWIQKKGLEGDPVAQYNLYKTLMDGRAADPNVNLAMSWLQRSADGGFPLAAKMMAFYYEHGFILKKNIQMEIKYLRIAAQADDGDAQYKLGSKLLGLAGTAGQRRIAVEYLEKAAINENPDSQFTLGQMLFNGMVVDRDLKKALSWNRRAAKNGHKEARMATLFMEGLGWGTEQDTRSLVDFYRQWLIVHGSSESATAEGQQRDMEWFRSSILPLIERRPAPPSVEPYSEQQWRRQLEDALKKHAGGEDIIPPRIVYQPAPTYPPGLRFFGVEETVGLMLSISMEGRITDHSFTTPPLPQFREAVEAILPYWRFIPLIRDGEVVATTVRIAIPFRIKSNSKH